ncbi:acyl carrier protein [Virgisporangium ochraceum]|jgi:acyl carrier protein|uniref:Acyl carrier protein n=1 Tax=Virgisporangium ochraceum TaxID=65505 RepID=A0A8J4A6S4_9ACTN|nr:acyl carrier protein [Virgisporangium ochraceum]GIJ74910.1 acyl carrier protein [Virgisporangium ochraceum]
MTTTGLLDRERLRAIVAEVLDLEPDDVTDDASFIDDLGVDSLMALEIVVVLEKRFGVRFAETELRQVTSLDQAYDLVAAKLR